MAAGLLLLFSSLILLCVVPGSDGVWLNLPSGKAKCVSEEIQSNVVVLGDYYVISDDHVHPVPSITVKVTSPYGKTIHNQQNITYGQFAFTTTEGGNYIACFISMDGNHQGAGDVSVSLDWRTGIAAKDWESVAKRDNIEGLELELAKLEGVIESIRENILYLKRREWDMRMVSESANARVTWFSIISVGVCILVSIFQILYLKQYFQRKKLI